MGGLRRLKKVFQSLGGRVVIPYLLAKRFGTRSGVRKTPVPRNYRLHPSTSLCRVYCRAGSNDKHAFSHVFIEQEYRFLKDVGSPKVVLDCGENVGY
jgi:hypothetical protein